MAFDSTVQRRIMGHFATGVTVVTTRCGEELCGLTVSSFCSLSLSPPLVSIAIDHRTYSYAFLKSSGVFAVNILSSEQEDISRRFAMAGPKNFADLPIISAVTGSPILSESLGWVDCRTVQVYGGGDHDIFVGEIVAGDSREAEPLLYYHGRYRRLADLES